MFHGILFSRCWRGVALILAMFVAVSAGVQSAAFAEIPPRVGPILSSSEEASVREQLTAMRVPRATQNELFGKLERGEVWDSMNGSDPVSTEVLDNGYTLDTFADGSATLTGIESPSSSTGASDGVALFETTPVTDCVAKPNDSSGYLVRTNCTVRKSYAIQGMKFEGDYKVKAGSPGYITGVRHGDVWSYVANYEILDGPAITQSSGSGDSPATARLSAKFTSYSGYPTTHGYVQMNVSTSAWVTWG